MTNKGKSIENLQKALSMELTAIHQYLLHAHVLDDWGLDVLAEKMRGEMSEELGHAGQYIDRILFLGGDPKVAPAKEPKRASSLEAMFRDDLADETDAVAFYTEAAEQAGMDADIGTRRLFENIAIEEEGHMDWLSQQLELLSRMGEPTFMAKNMSGGQ